MNRQDLDAERLRLLAICASATGDALKSNDVDITEKVDLAAEFVATAREILEKQEAGEIQ